MKYTIKKTIVAEFSKKYEIEINERFIELVKKEADKFFMPEIANSIKKLNLTVEDITIIIADCGQWCGFADKELDNLTESIYLLCCEVINDENASILQDWSYYGDIEEDDETGKSAIKMQLLVDGIII